MPTPKLSQTLDKSDFSGQDALDAYLYDLSKEHPTLVFTVTYSLTRIYIEAYASRSAIPFTTYETHLRSTPHFIQDGTPLLPTPTQQKRVNRHYNATYLT